LPSSIIWFNYRYGVCGVNEQCGSKLKDRPHFYHDRHVMFSVCFDWSSNVSYVHVRY